MQRISRKNTTYLGMAFLFVSLAITPVSLKALGVSPNLFAGVDAWRQISNVFGDGHQPVAASEILALNKYSSGEDIGAGRENEAQPLMIAETLTPSAELLASAELMAPMASSNQQKRCPKSALRAAQTFKQAEIVAFANPENVASAQQVESVARPALRIERQEWAKIGKQLAQYRVEIDEAVKIVPIRDMSVMVKLKSLNLSLPRLLMNCDSRKSLTPEQVKEIRLRASRMPAEPLSPSAPENCEL
jgi:hypothetical protein